MQQSQKNSMVNSIKSRGKDKSKKKKGSRSREQVVDDIELIILVSFKKFIGVNTEKDSVIQDEDPMKQIKKDLLKQLESNPGEGSRNKPDDIEKHCEHVNGICYQSISDFE
ncbi:hypothetical protein HELRODRAFT_162918 [Helobdella robusta]|uniref:Uncharacterized protein n=1 Tax=Helobdella robusta TaxID=6412 RepID=T1ETC8_HELRO|nr:hypothetical protein HELRODRAFT_162918 [Helobdella robusta]ESN99376.1 hypothetical protein HELRODRAFT_162918 [Helobdella robusta]